MCWTTFTTQCCAYWLKWQKTRLGNIVPVCSRVQPWRGRSQQNMPGIWSLLRSTTCLLRYGLLKPLHLNILRADYLSIRDRKNIFYLQNNGTGSPVLTLILSCFFVLTFNITSCMLYYIVSQIFYHFAMIEPYWDSKLVTGDSIPLILTWG